MRTPISLKLSYSKVFLMEKYYSQMRDSCLWTDYPALLNKNNIEILGRVSQGLLIHFYTFGSLLQDLISVVWCALEKQITNLLLLLTEKK